MALTTDSNKAISTLNGSPNTKVIDVPVPAGSKLIAIKGIEQTTAPQGGKSLVQLQFVFGKNA
jgi:hypothetical protein